MLGTMVLVEDHKFISYLGENTIAEQHYWWSSFIINGHLEWMNPSRDAVINVSFKQPLRSLMWLIYLYRLNSRENEKSRAQDQFLRSYSFSAFVIEVQNGLFCNLFKQHGMGWIPLGLPPFGQYKIIIQHFLAQNAHSFIRFIC